jgi:hypothetical protein
MGEPIIESAEAADETIIATSTLHIPGPYVAGNLTPITVVLARGKLDDYAAYIGVGTSKDFVRNYGNKLSFEMARGFFSHLSLDEAHYRK